MAVRNKPQSKSKNNGARPGSGHVLMPKQEEYHVNPETMGKFFQQVDQNTDDIHDIKGKVSKMDGEVSAISTNVAVASTNTDLIKKVMFWALGVFGSLLTGILLIAVKVAFE